MYKKELPITLLQQSNISFDDDRCVTILRGLNLVHKHFSKGKILVKIVIYSFFSELKYNIWSFLNYYYNAI